MSSGRTEVAPPAAPALPASETNSACVHYRPLLALVITSIRGTDPQNLMKYITRQKIYDCRFWKEERRLRTRRFFPQMHRRQSTAHQIPFLDPGDELIQEFISQDHFKYEWKRVYIDEFKHELLTSTANSCGIALPRLPFREALQQEGIFTRPAEANRLERSRPRGRRIGTISQI
jgi:hypothetical protein